MFLKRKTIISTTGYFDKIEELQAILESADAIVVGAGAGMSTSAGFTYDGERFEKYFLDYKRHYGIKDMYSGGFYPYETLEEYWAWWSRHIYVNRYDFSIGEPYKDLQKLLQDKEYFVITTNVDHQFQLANFDKKRLFYTQGDYGLWQCSRACHQKTYDNEAEVRKMITQQKDFKIPTELVPRCPVCNAPMTMNLRCDDLFVQDIGWEKAYQRYHRFISENEDKHIVYLELGVGGNTPGIIKYPFWKKTLKNPLAYYVCINYGEAYAPRELENQSICIGEDIGKVLKGLTK